MIDWINVLGNGLWIAGLSAALGTLSYASWEASMRGEKFKEILSRRSCSLGFTFSGILFTTGLAITSLGGWRVILWGGLAVVFLVLAVFTIRTSSGK